MNPNLDRTNRNLWKLTVSNAFSASSVIIAVSSEGLALAISRTVRTFLMFNVADLPWVKLCCDGVNEGRHDGCMGASLFARILDKIFVSKFKREIRR